MNVAIETLTAEHKKANNNRRFYEQQEDRALREYHGARNERVRYENRLIVLEKAIVHLGGNVAELVEEEVAA